MLRVRASGAACAACAERGPQGNIPAGLFASWGEGPRSGGVFRPPHRPACGAARARLAQGTRQECYARGPRARSGNLPPCGPFLRYEVQRCLPDALLVLSEVVLI